MSSRREEKERRRQERLAAEQAQQRAASRRRRLQIGRAAVALVAIAAAVPVVASSGGSSRSTGSSGLLAPTRGEAVGPTVDGIECQSMGQVLFHIHAHLAVYFHGHKELIPEGIGIPVALVQQTSDGPVASPVSCVYWLHSHTRDGVVHIESPIRRTFTLGNYFDLWKQPLTATQVGPDQGPVTAYLDGKRYTRNPASIPLTAHALIQLDVGTPVVKPQPFTFAQGL
jgi:hypothetical protein